MSICKVCNDDKAESIMQVAEQYVLELIQKDHPEWVKSDGACPKCIQYYKDLDTKVTID